MNTLEDHNNPGLKKGDIILDFKIIKSAQLKEINSFYYELEHIGTRAKYVHISNDDTENTFSVAFKTVPWDSTGVAHILEHTVLCGSQKFPVRDPFFSMIKRSLNTFMNAFTASDWTMYPFSTQNKKDFYNLLDVYLDAAFFPNIDLLSFKQEGHRLEFEGNKLVYKGVVYNEMKGAMSSPDQVLRRSILKALYPDNTYSNNSGGDPAVIPSLTHQQLVEFHKRHYHPSNSFFYTYGNMPLKDHLAFIQEKTLSRFQAIDPKTDVRSQPRWNKPETVIEFYPLAPNEDPGKKCQICTAWLTSDIKDSFEVLSLSLLEEILLGNSASPLRKALMDSGLGTALSDASGFSPDNRDTMFACGLKDVEESSGSEIEKIINNVLENLVKEGIDTRLIDAAIHQMEFQRKEVSNVPYPYGIKLLMVFCGTWFHGGDPLRVLEFDEDLHHLRDEMKKGRFFENLIQKYFLDNKHKVVFTLKPDQAMAQKEAAEFEIGLKAIAAELTDKEKEQINKDAKALKILQESSEDISILPTLELEDIPPMVKSVLPASMDTSLPAQWYEQPTSGIFYYTSVAGIGTLSASLMPLVPFFCYAFSKSGTRKHDYTEIARLLSTYTGGLGLSANVRTRYEDPGECLPFISFSGKCLNRNEEKMFEIISELLTGFNFADLPRLKTLLLEYRASMESMIVRNGHSYAISLASRNFSATRTLSEIWSGVHQLKTIKEITDNLDNKKLESIAQDMRNIGKHVFTQKNMKFALVGESPALFTAVAPLNSIISSLDSGKSNGFTAPDIKPGTELPREGWSTSSAVSFVAKAFEAVPMGHEDAPALSVISKILRSMYLHREIREKGGAYGGFAVYNKEDGLFCLGSYRDPHIAATLKIYDNSSDFIKSGEYNDEDVKEAILQVCSDIDKPDTPANAAKKHFSVILWA